MGQRMVAMRTMCWALLFMLAVSVPVVAWAATGSEPLAEVNGEAITAEEVEKTLGASLYKLEEQIYTLKRQQVDALIGERLLATEAAKRGISVPELLDAEVTSHVRLVGEEEIARFYQANKDRLKGDEASLREQIRTSLQNSKLTAQRETFLRSLREQAQVVVHLKPPPIVRAEVTVDGAPFRGPAAAPVTIVEFQDFHCPFCQRVQPTLAQLLARYRERVKLVYRDFPLDTQHPQARKAHEAARCAGEQGQFWEYHDRLFTEAPKTSPEQLHAAAQQLGLDLEAFERCLRSGTYQAAVQQDVAEGMRLGVTGTPTFFINGRLLTGAQPFESFVRVIEEELARAP